MINDFDLNQPGVYFRKGKRDIKIGKGKVMKERLEGARTDADDGVIEIVGCIASKDYHREEIEAHSYFAEFRKEGEWFDITPEQVKLYIESKQGRFFREGKILEKRTRTTVQTLWGVKNVSILRKRCAWYPEHQVAVKFRASGNGIKSEVYHTIPVKRSTRFNENHPSFSHKGKGGMLKFYASGKRYKEWNEEKRLIRKTPAK